MKCIINSRLDKLLKIKIYDRGWGGFVRLFFEYGVDFVFE